MSGNLTSIDINSMKLPDLYRIVEEVKATKTPRILKRDHEAVAMLMPVGTNVKPEKKPANQHAIAATLALAGSWSDLDWDDMIRQLDRIRHESTPTPPIDLDL